MKLDLFIAGVLNDINSGLEQARKENDKRYVVETSQSRGVNFDIAVTTVNSSGTQAEGKAKVGFIEVLGANVGAKMEDKKENSQVSRIQFTVFVPSKTEREYQVEQQRLEAERQSESNLDPYYG